MDPFDHTEGGDKLFIQDLLACWFQGGLVVFLPRLASTLRAWINPRGIAALLRARIISTTR
ncbi:hypothetical protein HMPREF0293_2242 [Corynebacterium glucuronolyticum ATCC 51866]|uniref:Uncharacterized protein n=1 Tax=Corynebacterium glucuronolyticum ATCC 51866 TaxID=548478 RepID=A0ABM9XLR3_9CORY|nr:hypothetical protein HMPREF0293_2242 [Corynebacterium glucuronolyticum ATCC 51866]